jgi:hypothetical protein
VLRQLAIQVIAAEVAAPSMSGHEAFTAARDRTAGLLSEWVRHVRADGLTAVPPFAVAVSDIAVDAEADMAAVKDALLYPPAEEMWQLCAPADLGALNTAVPPFAIKFASRLGRAALAGHLPGEDPVWTSSGSFAGQLRLVQLRSGIASSNWADAGQGAVPGSRAAVEAPVIPDNPVMPEPS